MTTTRNAWVGACFPKTGIELTSPNPSQSVWACSGLGFAMTEPDEIGASLEQALSTPKASVIDVAADQDVLIGLPKLSIGQAPATVREALETLVQKRSAPVEHKPNRFVSLEDVSSRASSAAARCRAYHGSTGARLALG